MLSDCESPAGEQARGSKIAKAFCRHICPGRARCDLNNLSLPLCIFSSIDETIPDPYKNRRSEIYLPPRFARYECATAQLCILRRLEELPAAEGRSHRTPTMDGTAGTTPAQTGTGIGTGTGTGSTEGTQTSPHTSLEHQRKRLSFFGRSSSEANTHKRTLSSLNATMAPSKGSSDSINTTASRPSTALSQTRRKKTDPLDSIRKSLFGLGTRKKAPANDQVNPPRPGASRRSLSRQSQTSESADTTLIPFATPSTRKEPPKEKAVPEFNDEEQCEHLHPLMSHARDKKLMQAADYQHRKKSSISRPFNFQHLTHTAKKHLPGLQTVDEKNLTAKFWSVNAYQKPKDELKEIKADDLSDTIATQPSELSLDRPYSSQATTEVAESLDETIFDETQETKFNPDAFETIHEVQPATQPAVKPPKHYSSMSALTSPSVNDPEKLRHLIKERASRDEDAPRRPRRAATTLDVRASLPVRPAPLPESLSGPLENRLAGQSHREKQPLPPVPARALRKPHSKGSLRSGSMPFGQLFPSQHGFVRASSAAGSVAGSVAGSFVSKRSSKSVATVNSRTDVFTEPTWEDDIDFAFDQEAEATCDFDWENTASPLHEEDESALTPVDQPTPDDDDETLAGGPGGVRLSAWLGDAPSSSGSQSPAPCEQGDANPASSGKGQRQRGTSVGHRGFQAARTLSSDAVAQTSPLMTLKLTNSASGSPVPLIKASLLECEKSPYTEGEMNFPGFESSRLPEYLSDPESSSRSSQRRKSSSTISYESSGRSLQTGSDTTRWSATSTGSLPDLLHSRRKSRSSVRMSSRISRTLESVTSADEEDGEALTVPRPDWTRAQTDPIIMRRPSASGARALLSAGRTVQRGRSATPPSRVALASSSVGLPDKDHAGWI